MDYSDSIEINVPADVAFAALSDLPSMGKRSPENTGGFWANGATGPSVGARFVGTNARGEASWSTKVRVTTFDPPHCFVFEVTYKWHRISRWEFCVESTPTGCRVIEKWRDRRNYFRRRAGDANGFSRLEFTKTSIRQTLEGLKRELEAGA